ncbi:hypothetical protein PIROE2DRAFT_4057 [Piromyces sp. E2]|nr:hypothetical protein PIROE2DRAFT_4057 [Piromyces sp. E2]|eukprot:OUM68307.1 hypothetical protein PIROE2DRAFT_4057 [Piromyces sp. E2]
MNKNSKESLVYENYSIINDNSYVKNHSPLSKKWIDKSFQYKLSGPLSSKIKKTFLSNNSNRSNTINKIRTNDYSFIDLNKDSRINSSISSILSPNIINHHLKKEKDTELKNKKIIIKQKKLSKKKIPMADDFDTLLNRIEQVVSNDKIDDPKKNIIKLNEHHHCNHSCNNKSENKENKSEDELLLKVKKALISNEIKNQSQSHDQDTTKNNNFNFNFNPNIISNNSSAVNNDENNDNNYNQYSKILLDSISEIPSIDEKTSNPSSMLKSNEKQANKNNHYDHSSPTNNQNHIDDHSNYYEMNNKKKYHQNQKHHQ